LWPTLKEHSKDFYFDPVLKKRTGDGPHHIRPAKELNGLSVWDSLGEIFSGMNRNTGDGKPRIYVEYLPDGQSAPWKIMDTPAELIVPTHGGKMWWIKGLQHNSYVQVRCRE
jgi:hypothetical protein